MVSNACGAIRALFGEVPRKLCDKARAQWPPGIRAELRHFYVR